MLGTGGGVAQLSSVALPSDVVCTRLYYHVGSLLQLFLSSLFIMTSPVLHQVDLLARQFHEQVDPNLLPLPQGRDIVHPAVQSAIYAHMFDETSVWPIPPVNYQTRVLKRILSRIEEAISDPEEDV